MTIPAITAASLHFDAQLTALDQATVIVVTWLAAQRDGRTVDVSEAGLREALVGPRRAPDNRRDDERMARLEQSYIRADERLADLTDGVAAPVIEPGMRRTPIEGRFRWTVDPGLSDAFRLQGTDAPVAIPAELLRRARCRFTLPLYLRVAAWAEGELDRKWIRKATETSLLLRIPMADFLDDVGFDGKPAVIERNALAPACREITTVTHTALEAALVRVPSLRGPGRVLAVDMLISRPSINTVRQRVRKPKAEEPLPSNVYRLRPPLRTTLAEFPKSDEPVEF